jgi:hypothetical protein
MSARDENARKRAHEAAQRLIVNAPKLRVSTRDVCGYHSVVVERVDASGEAYALATLRRDAARALGEALIAAAGDCRPDVEPLAITPAHYYASKEKKTL